jgi:predicted RNA binding protein YcfA (HicA-like mRNA interferase family)
VARFDSPGVHRRDPSLSEPVTGRIGNQYPSIRWPKLSRVLEAEPLGYRVTRQAGSHRTLEADGRPTLHLSFHDRQEIPSGLVRKILIQDVGLTDDEALALL